MATPFKGSKIANLVINLHETYPHVHGFADRLMYAEGALLSALAPTIDALHHGAICDLAESSTATEFAAVPEVYGIVHAGTAGRTAGLTAPLSLIGVPFSPPFGDDYAVAIAPYTLTTLNDGVVEVSSAEGNLPRWSTGTVVEHFRFHSDELFRFPDLQPPVLDGPMLGIASSVSIARQVRDALDTPAGWEPLPAVQRESGQIGVPVSGGRGEIDNISWLNQCAPGGPLNRMGN